MKAVVLFTAAITTAVFVASSSIDGDFEEFKAHFNKLYKTNAEEQSHKRIFARNKAYIDNHNADGSSTYTLGINEYTDIDPVVFTRERRNRFLGHLSSMQPADNITVWQFHPAGGDLPASVDWRDKGVVTGVKNEGMCGSCWAFSVTGTLEGQHAIKTGNLVSLSEQQLIDCCTERWGNHGCQGGLMTNTYEYIKNNGGIDTEESYPYKGENGKCKFRKSGVGATCTGYVNIKRMDCNALKEAVARVGPIAVAMDATGEGFPMYKSGIWQPKDCSTTELDHTGLVVGYGTENGTDYWLVKNSFGTSWGIEGYFKIAMKNNLCGICTMASYPTV